MHYGERGKLFIIVAGEKRKKDTEVKKKREFVVKRRIELMDEMKVLSVARISGKYALLTD